METYCHSFFLIFFQGIRGPVGLQGPVGLKGEQVHKININVVACHFSLPPVLELEFSPNINMFL